jgi:hypothetical protein
VRLDTRQAPLTDADAERYLLHEDGFLRVPVLVVGDLVVRGYTEELYREALGGGGPKLSPACAVREGGRSCRH